MPPSHLFPRPQASRAGPVSPVLTWWEGHAGTSSAKLVLQGTRDTAPLASLYDVAGWDPGHSPRSNALQAEQGATGFPTSGPAPPPAQSTPGRMSPPPRTPQKPSQHHSSKLGRRWNFPAGQQSKSEGQGHLPRTGSQGPFPLPWEEAFSPLSALSHTSLPRQP